MQDKTENKAIVTFTPQAVEYLKKQLTKQPAPSVIRMYVKTAGCSGLQYKFDFVAQSLADDVACEVGEQLIVYIDKKAIPFIEGTMVDYVKQGLNAQFKFTNPLEKGSCGCGESFYV